VQSIALALSGLYPATDALEIFQGNSSSGALRLLYDCFADAMVYVALISGLAAGHLLQFPFRRLAAILLKILAAMLILAPVVLYGFPGVASSIAVAGEIDNSEVNPKNTLRKEGFRIIDVADNSDVPRAANEHEVNLSMGVRKHGPLMLTADEGNLLPAFKRPDGHRVFLAEPEDSVVVWLSGVLAESPLLAFEHLVRINDLADAPHSHLGRKTEPFPGCTVDFGLEAIDLKALVLPCLSADPVASFVGAFQGCPQGFRLLWRREKFYVGNQLHRFYDRNAQMACQGESAYPSTDSSRWLLGAKAGL